MLTDAGSEAITLYQFHEDLLQLSGCLSMSEAERADLSQGGVFVCLYPPQVGAGEAPARVVLTFPLGTRVQAVEALAEQAGSTALSPTFVAITSGPASCEVRFSAAEAPAAGVIPCALSRKADAPSGSGAR